EGESGDRSPHSKLSMSVVQGIPYDRELRVSIELAREAGASILALYKGPLNVEQKSYADDYEPVTDADRVANDLIVTRLGKEFPQDGVLAEESLDTKHRLEKSRVWMVDPLDGTTGFIQGNGDFAVQIGLVENGECVVGVVYQPATDRLYRATKGGGTWIERPQSDVEQAFVSNRVDLASMRLAASRSHRSPRMNTVVSHLGFKDEVQRGSVGIKIGLLVERQCDVYIHLSPRTKQWDTCAPQLILSEAGGKLTDLFGQSLNYNVPDIQNRNGLVATNGISHDTIIRNLAPILAEFGRKPFGMQ
ncbi:MAG TPA: 3'(2'),5'-bisphosphate nucleotidase CysQ, partial [Pyrinomonadaceae bacterium]